MTITIEDLEALKELNDELEENHVETEKQLNEEIGELQTPTVRNYIKWYSVKTAAKESQIREQVRKIAELEDACQDFEGTINQFRDLVMQLQTYVKFNNINTRVPVSQTN